jgi:hypothetical protein
MPYHQGEGGGITSAVKKKASEDKANLEKESTMLQGALQVGSHGERQAAMLDLSCVVNNTDSTEVQEASFIDAV